MKTNLLLIGLLAISTLAFSQAGVGIGVANPDASATLHVQSPSTPKGMLIPRLTTVDRNNITAPAEGLLVYDTDVNALMHYNGSWQNVGMPAGAIIMWSGASVPAGWAICDGGSGTPDLRGRFIVASGQNQQPAQNETNNPSYTIGPGNDANAGRNQITLTTNELPAHTHNASSLPHSHTDNIFSIQSIDWRGGGSDSPGNGTGRNVSTGITGSTTVTVNIASAGSGQAFENRPPYYVLAFIMKL